MALFSPSERGLPLLTHVFQLDADKEGEIEQFYDYMEQPLISRLSPSEKELNNHLDRLLNKPLFPQLAEIVLLAQRMMAALCDRQKVNYDDWKALQGWYGEIEIKWGSTQKPDEAGEIPASSLRPNFHPNEILMLASAMRIIVELWQCVTTDARNRLARCKSCDNVFLRDPRHPQQKYCSSRCSGRERLKKFREKQKS